MIPIRDENPTQRFPWVTVLLIVCNVGVFAYEISLDPTALEAFILRWGFLPSESGIDADGLGWTVTAITATFLHAGWLHLGGNMLYLWIFGNNVEDRLGPARYIAFYLTGGVLATAAQWALAPDSSIPLVGASGAIAAVLGGYALLYPRARVLTVIPILFILEVAAVPAIFVIGFWFLIQLASGIGSLGNGTMSGGVAWFAHLGGFAAGALMILPAALKDLGRARRRGSFRTWN